jgi:hypothetical protein
MDGAEILDRSCRREGLRKRVASVECAGVKPVIDLLDHMGDVVVIDPSEVVPTGTVKVGGSKVKLAIFTCVSAANASALLSSTAQAGKQCRRST